jgi:hypothetical protein
MTIDGSDANEAAIKRYDEEHGTAIAIRQVKLQSMQGSLLTPLLQNRACEFPRTRLLND